MLLKIMLLFLKLIAILKCNGSFSRIKFLLLLMNTLNFKVEGKHGYVEQCRAPLLEECPQHHGHKGDPRVTLETCGAIGERAQVIFVWVRAPGRWERLSPIGTRSHEG